MFPEFKSKLFFAVLCGILIAGICPIGYTFKNDVVRLSEPPGIRFGEYGIAFTRPFLSAELAEELKSNGFSIEIALKRASTESGGFKFIAAFHNGNDHSQFVLGQWRSHIIVMNGDDYKYNRGLPRLSMDTSVSKSDSLVIAVTTKSGWSKLYLNGKLINEENDVAMTLPGGPTQGRLVLGNSIHGRHTWTGAIHGFALYGDVLTDPAINEHNKQWRRLRNFSFVTNEDPYLLYVFDEKSGPFILDHSRHKAYIEIPSHRILLERDSFVGPLPLFGLNPLDFQDVLINLIGFLPFGFVLASIFYRAGGIAGQHSIVLVVLCGFMLSFGIEFLQSWMPSRSSSLHDLILNIVGSYLGGLVFILFARKNFPWSPDVG